ncbi:MAG: hypothetical protein FJY29_04640 [Betaproteobacteria bacterium]|nr:hypothetical protein [Betaproteobacteria bacterium]
MFGSSVKRPVWQMLQGLLKSNITRAALLPILMASVFEVQKAYANATTFSAGFAKENINPTIDDPKRPIWIAGFGQKRQAKSIHDPLWARAIALSNGSKKGVIVSLDAIGFMHNDIIDVRNAVQKQLQLDFVIISSTHNHEAPDLIGIWGPSLLKTGVDSRYLALVKERSVQAIRDAVAALEPVQIHRMELPNVCADVLVDTRLPQVFDSNVRALRFVARANRQTLGTLVTWANHPEVLWNANTAITSDFVHYLREGIETGIRYGDNTLKAGLGGTAVFINGAVGGLMTTLDTTPVLDTVLNETLLTPSFEKARAVGYRVAEAVIDGVNAGSETEITDPTFNWSFKSLLLPVDNLKFRAAAMLRVIRRQFEVGFRTRSEVGLLQLGDTWIGTIPGELYPEIANGGIEAPAGNDFKLTAPVEVPHLRSVMRGQMNMLLGLTNDQIGYIIPRSQWDEKEPYTYNDKPYGEENSLGPKTAPLIHRALIDLFSEAQ